MSLKEKVWSLSINADFLPRLLSFSIKESAPLILRISPIGITIKINSRDKNTFDTKYPITLARLNQITAQGENNFGNIMLIKRTGIATSKRTVDFVQKPSISIIKTKAIPESEACFSSTRVIIKSFIIVQ